MVEHRELAVGAEAHHDARHGEEPVGRGEVRDDHGDADREPVGHLDDDRGRRESGVQLGVDVRGFVHDGAHRSRRFRVGHPEALRGESRIDLVVDHLPVDDHHQPGSVGDRRSGTRDGGRDRVGRRADRGGGTGQRVGVEVEVADAAVAPDLLGFGGERRARRPLRCARAQELQPRWPR